MSLSTEEVLIGALDESTTSTKFIIFDTKGNIVEEVSLSHK